MRNINLLLRIQQSEIRIPKSEIGLGGIDDDEEFGFLIAEIAKFVRDS
jgi:hypothetical protein